MEQPGNTLVLRSPQQRESAEKTFSLVQKLIIFCLAVTLATAVWFFGWQSTLETLVGSVTTIYLIVFGYRTFITVLSLNHSVVSFTDEEIASLKDSDLPTYTIIVPLATQGKSFRGKRVILNLIQGLQALDYPQDKLQIILSVEESIPETVAFVTNHCPEPPFEIDIIPLSEPQTKPKACNISLRKATGEKLVIYDGEDIPDPLQLKKAVIAQRRLGPEYVCFQAKLEFRNLNDNWLTRMFTGEYDTYFSRLLPGLSRSGLPVPLSGTSNHFDTATVRILVAWDGFNTTEDFDLGMWIARQHTTSGKRLRVAIIDSVTTEEANSKHGNWIRQRSRWIKGFMQTYLVHMRHPWILYRDLGLVNFLSFQIIAGITPFMLLINPIFWVLTVVYFVFQPQFIRELYPTSVLYVGNFSWVVGNALFLLIINTVSMEKGKYGLLKWTFIGFIPYWLMMSIAAWKGFAQLIGKPHFWEKTEHGFEFGEVQESDLIALSIQASSE